jgi:hypothetical protein
VTEHVTITAIYALTFICVSAFTALTILSLYDQAVPTALWSMPGPAWGRSPPSSPGVASMSDSVTVPREHPLSQEHLECLNRVLARCPAAIECAQAAVECGWPFEEFLAELQKMQGGKLRFS